MTLEDASCLDTAMLIRLIIACTAILAAVILIAAVLVVQVAQRATSADGGKR